MCYRNTVRLSKGTNFKVEQKQRKEELKINLKILKIVWCTSSRKRFKEKEEEKKKIRQHKAQSLKDQS